MPKTKDQIPHLASEIRSHGHGPQHRKISSSEIRATCECSSAELVDAESTTVQPE